MQAHDLHPFFDCLESCRRSKQTIRQVRKSTLQPGCEDQIRFWKATCPLVYKKMVESVGSNESPDWTKRRDLLFDDTCVSDRRVYPETTFGISQYCRSGRARDDNRADLIWNDGALDGPNLGID